MQKVSITNKLIAPALLHFDSLRSAVIQSILACVLPSFDCSRRIPPAFIPTALIPRPTSAPALCMAGGQYILAENLRISRDSTLADVAAEPFRVVPDFCGTSNASM